MTNMEAPPRDNLQPPPVPNGLVRALFATFVTLAVAASLALFNYLQGRETTVAPMIVCGVAGWVTMFFMLKILANRRDGKKSQGDETGER
jgi:hypothetical protein